MVEEKFQMHKLIRSNGLTAKQLLEIKELSTICNAHDNITMKLNWDFLNSRPKDEVQDFLYYSGDELIGFLALYIFNNKEAEVSSMVHPNYRKKGMFLKLLSTASEEVKNRDIKEMLFFTDVNSKSGIACLTKLQTTYDFSEHLMRWSGQLKANEANNELHIRPFDKGDREIAIQLDSACFHIPKEDAEKMIDVQLADPTNLRLVAEYEGKVVGKINVLLKENPAYIFGFCVLPSFQGKGFGQNILQATLSRLVELGITDIVLEVAIKNNNALKLYEKVGFELVTGYDYYRLKL
jgi:ribosomal protein S18 acetylase RimI-like enzyme